MPSSTSSLVSARPLMPPSLTAWRTRTASNQPQRRGRPVTVPNSWPRSPRPLADLVEQLGREGAGADPGGVGLADAEHEADAVRAGAGARGRGGRHRVGRGDERVGAVVDVEHGALRALEQDAAAGALELGQAQPDRLGERQQPGRQGGELGQQRVAVDLLDAEAAAQRVVVEQQLVDLGRQRVGVGEVADADGAARRLVLVGRADAAAGGADLAGALVAALAGQLARPVELAVQRQDQGRVLGDAQGLGADRHTLARAGARSPRAAPRGRPRRRCRSATACPGAPRPRAAATACRWCRR